MTTKITTMCTRTIDVVGTITNATIRTTMGVTINDVVGIIDGTNYVATCLTIGRIG